MQSERLTILNNDPYGSAWLGSKSKAHIIIKPDMKVAERFFNILVLSSATGLYAVADFVREANSRNHLKALFIHADVNEEWISTILWDASLRTLKNLVVHRTPDVPRRIINAWLAEAQNDLIADATVIGDRLLVRSCAMELLDVPFATVPALAKIPFKGRGAFEIAPDGNYLYWSGSDVHLDLEALKVAIDPAARDRADIERLKHNRRFGEAVVKLRKEQGLKQSDVKGVTARQIRRIEAGEFFPRVDTLEKMSSVHGMTLKNYLNALSASILA